MDLSIIKPYPSTGMPDNKVENSHVQYRGVGTGPAGPATAGPKFPEPTIKNIILFFVIKQIRIFVL